MSKNAHIAFIAILSVIVGITLMVPLIYGLTYYRTGLEERFFHDGHTAWKPSGTLGHGLGILGSLLMVIGVGSYMLRKRWRKLARYGLLRYWLEFHIFLCTTGPIMVLYHTAFKFGGLVAVSFWSMVAVFLSGIVGRFIYLQIPRTIEGRELSLNEVRNLEGDHFKDEASLERRIRRLEKMQELFRYWHVAHLPFALVMLVIMIIHIIVAITFGATWIF
jgi:hypothetical protein